MVRPPMSLASTRVYLSVVVRTRVYLSVAPFQQAPLQAAASQTLLMQNLKGLTGHHRPQLWEFSGRNRSTHRSTPSTSALKTTSTNPQINPQILWVLHAHRQKNSSLASSGELVSNLQKRWCTYMQAMRTVKPWVRIPACSDTTIIVDASCKSRQTSRPGLQTKQNAWFNVNRKQ